MFLLKQFLKQLILPPTPWIVLLVLVVIFWRRRWARTGLLALTVLIVLLHNGIVNNKLRYPLESRYPMVLDPRGAEPYDAIVVLTAHVSTPTPLTPFPSLSESMLHRLDEARRLYRIQPKPILVSGGWVEPAAPMRDDNKYAREYLLLWGVPEEHVLSESESRDTFESALQLRKILQAKGWRRYLLVTSAVHMPRSMLAFAAVAPEPIAAPGDFTARLIGGGILPSEVAAEKIAAAAHEYIGLVYYYWRVRQWEKMKD
ncbi:MAG: YdcF family protein [Candidatus Binatia bacterium]